MTHVTDHQLASLLCNALEGGSNYWYVIVARKRGAPAPEPFQSEWPGLNGDPFREGGSLTFETSEGDEINGQTRFVLDRAAIDRGFSLFRDTPHYADFIDENDDASTGDVFLQLCLFGDVIFG